MIKASDLRRVEGTGGGYECPVCKQMVRYSQPYAIFRRTVSLLLSVIVLLLVGVRRPIMLLVGSVLLWIPMSMLVNMYSVYATPLGLKPWKQRWRERRDAGPLELFDNKPK
jgi:hypothetical protein